MSNAIWRAGNTAVKHELDGPQPFLAYVRMAEHQWAIARHVNGDTEWWCDDDWGYPQEWRSRFISLASARAYANERGWE